MTWWAAGAAVVGAIGGSLIGAQGAKDAAGISADGAAAAAQAQLRMYQQSRSDNMPGQYVGTQALNTLAGVMGLNPWTPGTADYWSLNGRGGQGASGPSAGPGGDRGGMGGGQGGTQTGPSQQTKWDRGLNPWYDDKRDMSYANRMVPFFASPDYNFRMNEGLQQLDRYNAANGRYLSGAQLKATQRYAGNLASGEFGNWWNKMSGLAGLQQTASTQNANNAMETGRGLGAAYQNAADARASGYMGQANAWGQGIQGIGNAIGRYYQPSSGGGDNTGYGFNYTHWNY